MSKEGLAKSAGADTVLALDNPAALEQAKGTLDIILNTIPMYHDCESKERLHCLVILLAGTSASLP